jgi:hypothetical protein
MSFNQNIPQPGDKISQSQGQILGNFQSLYTWANANHVSFDLTNAGKHIYVQMPVQGAPPAFTLGEIDLWNQAYTVNAATKNEFYIRKENQTNVGTVDVSVPSTASILGYYSGASISYTGWTFLPSGILMQWGQATTAVGSVIVNLNAGGNQGPVLTQLFSCQASFAQTPAPSATLSCIIGFPNITINSNTAGLRVNYLAIGSGV